MNQLVAVFLAMSVLAFPAGVAAEQPGQPEITSQGFDFDETQAGLLGKFGRLRVRIEAPNRIAELHIKERSYEVDLANTPDAAHLQRFGLQTRPRQHKDVTLNFENYINEKLEDAGQYEILIRVTDKEGQSTRSTLKVSVIPEPATETSRVEPLREEPFLLSRAGAGPVRGTTRFGISWINTEAADVVIRVAKTAYGATKLAKLETADYEALETKEQLIEKMNILTGADTVELAIAHNGAAGEVLALVNRDRPYVLHVSESSTSLHGVGTVVTLRGTYKF